MAFCRVVFPLLVLSVMQCFANVQVPAFLWGDLGQRSIHHSALDKIPSRDFGVILKHELEQDPMTVIFMEQTLSVEDFSRKTDGETPFPYLHSVVGDALYLPSVESPLRVLNKYADPEKVDHVKLTENGLSAEIKPEGGKFLFINLKDAKEDESREELLRRHNDFMEDMFTKLQERYGKVVAIYTGHYPSWTIPEHSRVRRQATEAATPSTTDLSMTGLRIIFGTVRLNDGTNDVILQGAAAGDSIVNNTANEMHSTITFSNNDNVTLNFAQQSGYWMLTSANLVRTSPAVDEHLKIKEELYALMGFSYRCAVNITFATVNETTPYTLTFQNTLMQAYFSENSTDLEFGDSFNCVGFFTAPIWAGLFVVSILLSIIFYGIMMMMDINTNDRFDDPKGKTITINAVE
uniref:V-type proton ATPase subunit S1/VOA1 transmembrane domain-containing protein n=1 Tax=Pectinophora gossypiella TaxID=13191 RepID=A0A1E1WHE2_PECGO